MDLQEGRVHLMRTIKGRSGITRRGNTNGANRTLSPTDYPEIFKLYAFGETQEEIAERYGVTQGRISQILDEYRQKVPQQTKEEIISVFMEQCRMMFKGAMPKAARGDSPAIRDVIKIQERIAKMLGLDAVTPEQTAELVRYIIESEGPIDEDIVKALT